MKKTFITVLFFFLLNAHSAFAMDKAEWAYQILNVADFATSKILYDQGGYETNSLSPVSENSSNLELVGWCTIFGLAHYYITKNITNPTVKTVWQTLTIGSKLVVIGGNITIIEW